MFMSASSPKVVCTRIGISETVEEKLSVQECWSFYFAIYLLRKDR